MTDRKPTLNPNLRDFWRTRVIDDSPVIGRVLYGGRMSSKSHDAAGVAIARANHHCERFLCTRMFQNRISDSVYTLLKDKIDYFGLGKNFRIYADAIEHIKNGSLFRFYGIARNIDEIKSFEGATVWWNEESHNLTHEMFTTIMPTVMRNDGAEMWFTLNPRLSTDYAYRRLISAPPKGFLVRKINYDENPFLSGQALDDIRKEFDEDYELAQHIYDGVPMSSDDSAIIKRAWIVAAIDAHKKIEGDWLGGHGVVGYDVADDGGDTNAVTALKGRVIVGVDEWKAGEDELDKSAQKAVAFARANNCAAIGYDCIGVGASAGIHIKNAGIKDAFKFNAGEKVADPNRRYKSTGMTNAEMFSNLKAQSWWHVADLFRNTFNAITKGAKFDVNEMVSINSSSIDPGSLEKLIDELSTPRRDVANNGRVMVESKKDLKKRKIDSPNVADSLIIACSSSAMHKAKSLNIYG